MPRGKIISKISTGLYDVEINTSRISNTGMKEGKTLNAQCYCLSAGESFTTGETCDLLVHASNPNTGWYVISKGSGGNDYVANPSFQGEWSWFLNALRQGAVQVYKPKFWFGTIATISDDMLTAKLHLWSGGNSGNNYPANKIVWDGVPLSGSVLNYYLPGDSVVASFDDNEIPTIIGFAQKPRKADRIGVYNISHEVSYQGVTWVRKKDDVSGGPYYKDQAFIDDGFADNPMLGDYYAYDYRFKIGNQPERNGSGNAGSSFFNPQSNVVLNGIGRIIAYPGMPDNEYHFMDADLDVSLRYLSKSTGNRFIVRTGIRWQYGLMYEVGIRYSADLFPFINSNPGIDATLYDIIFNRRNVVISPSPNHYFSQKTARANYFGVLVAKETED